MSKKNLDHLLGEEPTRGDIFGTHMLDLFAVPFISEEEAQIKKFGYEPTTDSDKSHFYDESAHVIKVDINGSVYFVRVSEDFEYEVSSDLDFLSAYSDEDEEFDEE